MRISWKAIVASGVIGAAAGLAFALATKNHNMIADILVFTVVGIFLPIIADVLDAKVLSKPRNKAQFEAADTAAKKGAADAAAALLAFNLLPAKV